MTRSEGKAGKRVARVVRQATHAAALKAGESRTKNPDRIASMALKAADRAIVKALAIKPKRSKGKR
jgi:hypothetical protein